MVKKIWKKAFLIGWLGAGLAGFGAARILEKKQLDIDLAEQSTKQRRNPTRHYKAAAVKSTTSKEEMWDQYPQFIGDSRDLALKAFTLIKGNPAQTAIPRLALAFLGRPYKAFSLDKTRNETLRIDLTSFDCFLFVEQLIALFNTRDLSSLAETVRDLRYEDGKVSFCSRFHYFTHWADNSVNMGYISEISPSIPGSVRRSTHTDFMSRHSGAYAPMQLKANRDCIGHKEDSLIAEQKFVPVELLRSASDFLRTGDIFGLVTDVPSLDVTHVGFILKDGSDLDAIHAAPSRGVMISKDFASYASSVPNVVGVTFYRPLDRREVDKTKQNY